MSPTTRALTPVLLFALIAISFVGAIVSDFVQLLWLNQPLGLNGAAAASVCLFVFAGASLALLIFILSQQQAQAL